MDKSGFEYDNQYDWVPLLLKKQEEQQKEQILNQNQGQIDETQNVLPFIIDDLEGLNP